MLQKDLKRKGDNMDTILVINQKTLECKALELDKNNTLRQLQHLVDGNIEIPFINEKLYNNNIDVIINEEGKINDKCEMVIALNHNGRIIDILFGNIVFASSNKEGETVGLTKKQMTIVNEVLSLSLLTDEKEPEKRIMLYSIDV